MDILYIDSNKYLDYYRTNDHSIISSLEQLVKTIDSVFITKQMVDEFQRNKLQEAYNTLKKYHDDFSSVQWPPQPWFLGSEKSSQGKKKVIHQADRKKALESAICTALISISKGEDEITESLKPIFDKARTHTDEHFQKAERRKALGNPPGKKNDPIGDQLSWVMLLETLKKDDRVWVVSSDTDYMQSLEKIVFLNAYLVAEVRDRIVNIDNLFCFNNLSEALQDFLKKTNKTVDKATDKDLTEAAEAERRIPPEYSMGAMELASRLNLPFPSVTGIRGYSFAPYLPAGMGSANAPLASGFGTIPGVTGVQGIPSSFGIVPPRLSSTRCPNCGSRTTESTSLNEFDRPRITFRCPICGWSS